MKFDVNTFRFLADIGMNNGWNNYTLDDLKQYTEYLKSEDLEEDMPMVFRAVKQASVFLKAIEPALLDEEASNQVVSAESQQGVLTKVSGPRFYKNDSNDGIVLRVGLTSYDVKLENEKIFVGKLKGDVIVSKRTNANGDVVNSEKTGMPILDVAADLMVAGDRSKDAETFYIPFMLDIEQSFSNVQVKGSVEDGDLYQYLLPIPKGGGNYVDLRILPEGDYLVTDISDPKVGEYNGKEITSWNLNVPGVGIVSSRGKNLEGQLATSYKILQKVARNRGVTLRVSSHNVEYKTMNGEDRNVPYPNFVMDLKNGNVKNLPEGKIGNSDVKHLINAGILKDYHDPTSDFSLDFVKHVREIVGVPDQSALPEGKQPKAITAIAEVVDDDEIPF